MLKWLAIGLMTLDHFNRLVLHDHFEWIEAVSRFGFPMFAFMIGRNAVLTRNPRHYLLLLFGFAIIAQPVYAYAFDHLWFEQLNALVTLGLGAAAVRCWLTGGAYRLLIPLLVGAGWFVSYDIPGVLLILMFGLITEAMYRRDDAALAFALVVTTIPVVYFLNSPQYFLHGLTATFFCLLMLIPRFAELDRQLARGGHRLFFYAYYPAHLAVFVLLGVGLYA